MDKGVHSLCEFKFRSFLAISKCIRQHFMMSDEWFSDFTSIKTLASQSIDNIMPILDDCKKLSLKCARTLT